MDIIEADSDYRPTLNPEIAITDFETHYWLKEELQDFCKKNGIAVTGSKFFQSIIGPQFHFTTRFMNFCKNNVGKTYQDAIDEWYTEQKDKKDGDYITEIGPQFEYNKFIRNFFQNSDNKGKKLKEAIAAWQQNKRERGK